MAKILLVIEGEKEATLDEIGFTFEGKLQDYLEKYPSLIPIEDIDENAAPLLCIGREVGVPSGSIDLLFIGKDGVLTVVETKLAKNPEARRTVIGQILEYASYIYTWTADDVYAVANAYLGKDLDEAIEKPSDEDFRAKVEQNLHSGRIRLLIAVDKLVEPLRATVTFLNENSNFDILLLQVKSFEESESRKVLIPTLFGYTKPPPPSGRKPIINEDIFLARCREGGHTRAEELYFKAQELKAKRKFRRDFINWGVSGYSYRIPWKGYPLGTVIFVGRPDSIEVWLSGIIEGCGEAGQRFKENLRNIAEFRNKVDTMKAPWASTDEMASEDITAFISTVEQLGEALDAEGGQQT